MTRTSGTTDADSSTVPDENAPSSGVDRSLKRKTLAKRPKSMDEEMSKEDAKKFRPPSYTDRILIHSLKDRKSRLAVKAYDFCDTMRVSDHRAVSMTALLEVNASVQICILSYFALPQGQCKR